MKRIFTLLSLVMLCCMFATAQVNVTFRVNMSQQTVSGLGVHIAGDFQGWSTTASAMTNAGAGIYTKTFVLPGDSTYYFKFLNGNDWPQVEAVPNACGVGGDLNRPVSIGTRDTILPAICFSSCTVCPPPPSGDSVNVTFRVDMRNQTVDPSGVHIAGAFQNWNASTSEMDVTTGAIYSITFRVPVSTSFEYKFLNGDDWPYSEVVPAQCGVGFDLNRKVTVGTRDTILPAVCFAACTECIPTSTDSVNVTFRVDMQGLTVSGQGVHIAGNFQGWNAGLSIMAASGTVYSRTFKLPANATYQYKFINGNDWGLAEFVPALCGKGQDLNREAVIGAKDTILKLVCFSSCIECVTIPPADSVNVTFRVNMQGQTISPLGVHMAGNFQNWTPGNGAMSLQAGTTYVRTYKLQKNISYEFKFLNGNDWGPDEQVPVLCAVNGNRGVNVGTKDTVLKAYCYASCDACNIVTPPGDSVNVTFRVNMQGQTISPLGVHMAGNFQNWVPGDGPMVLEGGTVYARTYKLPKNASYEYKFVNGNDWGPDEQIPLACSVNGNRGVNVGAADTVLKAYCYGTCDACGIITPPADSVNVTFRVDMQNETVSANGVHIAGSFQNWSPVASAMAVSTGTIYTKTFKVPANATYQYKFLNGNDWPFVEAVPAGCGVGGDLNREVTIGANDTTLRAICFSACTECLVASGDSVNITFRVDMSQETISPDGVHLAGAFQNWDPATLAMDFAGAGIYTKTVRVAESANYEYKFINGNAWGSEETVPVGCGVGPTLNRSVTVGTTNLTLDVVCFSSCGACVPQVVVNVTFRVDMGSTTVSPNGVHLMGNFQGWDAAATEMIKQGTSTVYQILLPLAAGDTAEYKFVNGNTGNDAENPPANCTKGSTSNRYFAVPDINYTTPLVCYETCAACLVGIDEVGKENVSIYPSPAADKFTVQVGNAKAYRLNMYDNTGKLVKELNLDKSMNNISLDALSNGMYTVQLISSNEVLVKKIMVAK